MLSCGLILVLFFFFKQKTAYEMRISDWSSDVCSSDLLGVEIVFGYPGGAVLPIYDALFQQEKIRHILVRHEQAATHAAEGYARATGKPGVEIGRASCRERVCPYV